MARENGTRIGEEKTRFRSQPGPGGAGMGGGEKARDFSRTWRKLGSFCKPYAAWIAAALVMAAGGSILNIVGPSQLSKITDLITAGMGASIDLGAIGSIGMLLVVLYGLGFLLNYLQGFLMATVTQRVSKNLRTGISGKINRLPLRYFDSASYGDVLSRVTNDVDTIGQALNQSVGTLISSVATALGCLAMMLWMNVTLTIAAVFSVAVGFALMLVLIKKSQKYFNSQQGELGRINGYIEEIYAGHTVVKAYNGEEKARDTFGEINGRLSRSAWKAQFLSGVMQPLMGFIGNLGYVVVCVVGAALALNGSITFGVVVAFMVYIRLFTQPLSQIAQAVTSLQSAAAAGERVFEFLEEPELEEEHEKTAVLQKAKGHVEFCDVHFGYHKESPVINGFSTEVLPGQKIAIVGPTGAGKTTIVNLLMRFYEVNRGEIKIDGVPIQDMTRQNVHALFCMVLQDTWLFEGTIRENIIYNKQGVTQSQVEQACKAAGIHHFIRTLPQGYDTILNDKANLSAGQKQLITIARAMVDNAPMLILDEATSSVDTRTEALIQQAMDRLTAGRTSFVIAHRLSTIKNSDLILVMKDGDIIESGDHETLLGQDGFYAQLYNSQFEEAA